MKDWDYVVDTVLAKPGLFVGYSDFDRVAAFVEGFGTALADGTLARFRGWLARDAPDSPFDWPEMLRQEIALTVGPAVGDEQVIAHLRTRLSDFLSSPMAGDRA
ncbi:hypothetical protein [Cellulosimicrobium sp. Marseille-Q8652]